MRFHKCGCPALNPDGSIYFGPKLVGECGVWDLPCVTFVPDEAPLPLYQHGRQLDYRANKLSLKCDCLARHWGIFKERLPTLPKIAVCAPKSRDYHFFNTVQLRPERYATFRKHMKAGPLLDNRNQLPIPADFHDRYRALPGRGPDRRRSGN